MANKTSFFSDILESLVIAVLLAVLLRAFVFVPRVIPSGSMIPTLYEKDRIIVSKITYRFHPPQRGDVIVFRYPLDPKRNYVKRLVGLGGETVLLSENKLYINDRLVPETYLPPETSFYDFGPIKVPPGSYFVLGDNRMNSQDSRVWGFVERRLIIGKAVLLYWPPNRIGTIR
ncbi:MAG: signal peptidase I [Ammonifex sp.]|nr:MAG: signal peptidase I [Ammonifex sp.]